MQVIFGWKGGWNGGSFTYDGLDRQEYLKMFGKDPKPMQGMKGTCEMLGKVHDIEVASTTLTVNGVDHDHGHEYSWSYEEPMFTLSPDLPALPASLIWKNKGVIRLTPWGK